jgi:hypothetical protein
MVIATEYRAMAAEHHRLADMCRSPESREQHLCLETVLRALADSRECLHGARASRDASDPQIVKYRWLRPGLGSQPVASAPMNATAPCGRLRETQVERWPHVQISGCADLGLSKQSQQYRLSGLNSPGTRVAGSDGVTPRGVFGSGHEQSCEADCGVGRFRCSGRRCRCSHVVGRIHSHRDIEPHDCAATPSN